MLTYYFILIKQYEAYRLVVNRQNEILKTTGKKIKIHEIVSDAVIAGIESVRKE